MANIEGKDFTNFRHINLRGGGYVGGTPAPVGGVLRLAVGNTAGGLTIGSPWDSTISITPFGGASAGAVTTTDEVPYLSIVNAGLNIGTGFIRYVPFGGTTSGTLSVNTTYNDTDRAWTLPSKSGTFGISGTFLVNMPAVSANSYLSTLVTVVGVRTEDGVVVTPQTGSGVAVQSARGALFISEVLAGNGNLTLLFWNLTATATIPQNNVYAYTAVR